MRLSDSGSSSVYMNIFERYLLAFLEIMIRRVTNFRTNSFGGYFWDCFPPIPGVNVKVPFWGDKNMVTNIFSDFGIFMNICKTIKWKIVLTWLRRLSFFCSRFSWQFLVKLCASAQPTPASQWPLQAISGCPMYRPLGSRSATSQRVASAAMAVQGHVWCLSMNGLWYVRSWIAFSSSYFSSFPSSFAACFFRSEKMFKAGGDGISIVTYYLR